MQPENQPNKMVGIGLGIIVVLAVVLFTVLGGKKSTETPATTNDTTSQPVSTTTSDTTTETPADTTKQTSSIYKDGTYTATGSYMSPGGADQIKVTVTLKNDVITDTSAVEMAGDPKSEYFQGLFIGGYKAYVVGKNIADVKIGKVSGSSLTGIGFNDALAKIKVEAKA